MVSDVNKTVQPLLLICNITVVSTDIQNHFSFMEQCKESQFFLLEPEASESQYWCQKEQFGPFVPCGWWCHFSASAGCAVPATLPLTSASAPSFPQQILLQRCIKPHHHKHFKEDLHHSRGSGIKVTTFLGELHKFIPNILIGEAISVRAFLSFYFFFCPYLPFCFNYKFQGSEMKRERSRKYLM